MVWDWFEIEKCMREDEIGGGFYVLVCGKPGLRVKERCG